MATARDVISRAHRLIGLVASGDALPEADYQDGLVALNAMIESWQAEKCVVYAFQDLSYALSPADATITLGASGNITTRPEKIEQAFIRASDIDYQIELVEADRWYAIPDKTATSEIPNIGYYEPSYPQGVLNLFPVPTTAHTLHCLMWVPVSTLAALSTALAFPPGYERALTFNLAIELAPEHGIGVPASVASGAVDSKASIMRANHRTMIATTELGMMMASKSDIVSGGFA